MKDRVVGYVRVSTQGQVKDGYSLAYQTEEIQRYCASHNLELLDIYKDEGISGAKVDEDELTIEREGLQEMLSDLKWRDVKFIVVLNTSRLWRADIVKVLIQRELKRHKVDVKAIEQPQYSIYAHDPNDFLVNGMMELLDQYQRLEIALKLSRGRRKKAQEGGYAGGRVAYGYLAAKGQKTLFIDPVQADTVRRLFEIKTEHPSWSLSQIAAELNQAGYRTVQDKPFTKVQVKRILDREDFYRGMYRYGQIEAKGVHQPIII
ncbi:MAG: recombinase family protein [Paenibacillus macerans]|uniref:recombinase family protein n=1 Tax=Paenibacillus macerans TaxID=44252 RepID=UPI002907A747|nr:recombinase family protein [Paenibacillus macerans]MDU7473933.1 recombinase family protein [Paenibacillus macerans]